MTGRTNSRVAAYLVGANLRVAIPDGDNFDPQVERAEHEALMADPAFQARLARSRERRAQEPSGQRPKHQYNGRFLVRLPVSVHRQLAERAKEERTTLNQLVLNYLSRGLGLEGVEP